VDVSHALRDYELLRQAVVVGRARGTSGLAIILTRGLAAWLRVLREVVLVDQLQVSRTPGKPCSLKPSAGDDIVQLLANMVNTSWEMAYGH
jgi:hypothetical protein